MLILGIDVGTTGAKALVVNDTGETLGVGYKGYPLITKGDLKVEQDATKWYEAACFAVLQATSNVDRSDVAALSLSTQGASSLLVDKDFNPLTNAITWMDGRASKEKSSILERLGEDYVYKKTGWRTHPALDASKLLWINNHLRDIYNESAYFVSTLEYMNYRLTGVVAIDPTNCAIRQLMDIKSLEYDDLILEVVGGDKNKLPNILPTGKCLGNLTKQSARDFGLTESVSVYNGAHDQYCGLYGANIVNDGELMLSTGTAWVTVGVSNEPRYTDSYISPGPHVIKGKYGAMASLPVSGVALDWLKGNIIETDYDLINEHVESRLEKCKDLLFFPYLSGAVFPMWEENARGAFLGLALEHDKYDLALACMEGVVFQLRMALDEYPKVQTMRVMGGATQSKIWMKILSAVCDCDLFIMSEKDTPCIGAVLIAAVGEGLDYHRLVKKINKSEKYPSVDEETYRHYQAKYEKFKQKSNLITI
jgi:sugar (pentulose or hexulose) kinase